LVARSTRCSWTSKRPSSRWAPYQMQEATCPDLGGHPRVLTRLPTTLRNSRRNGGAGGSRVCLHRAPWPDSDGVFAGQGVLRTRSRLSYDLCPCSPERGQPANLQDPWLQSVAIPPRTPASGILPAATKRTHQGPLSPFLATSLPAPAAIRLSATPSSAGTSISTATSSSCSICSQETWRTWVKPRIVRRKGYHSPRAP